jgi:hypothetical protein
VGEESYLHPRSNKIELKRYCPSKEEELTEKLDNLLNNSNLPHSETIKKFAAIRAEFADLGLYLKVEERSENEGKTSVKFKISDLPTANEERSLVLASTSQATQSALNQFLLSKTATQVGQFLAHKPQIQIILPSALGETFEETKKLLQEDFANRPRGIFSHLFPERLVGSYLAEPLNNLGQVIQQRENSLIRFAEN